MAASDYCLKDDTAVPGTRFYLGRKPVRRNSSKDWDAIKQSAISGDLESIPSDVYIRYYAGLKRIAKDHVQPIGMVRTCTVFWGPTGTGKSHRAWEEASMEAYSKDPLTKWWDGYRGQEHVIVDEFRGIINISHLLRWLDKYPVSVETKGGQVPLLAKRIWITSNLPPSSWYPELDSATLEALLRRLEIIEINTRSDL
jgi:hypothetical protein